MLIVHSYLKYLGQLGILNASEQFLRHVGYNLKNW